MVSKNSKTLSFTPEQSDFLDRCIDSGRYESASEVVRAGLRLLADEEAARAVQLERVKNMIEAGAWELDRGETVDADAVFRRLQARRERMRREAAGQS